MKKTFKSLLCVMLIFAMTFSFAACKKDVKDNKTSQSENKKTDSKELATKTVENFMDAFCDMDVDEMAKYVADPKALKDAFPFDDIKDYVKEQLAQEMDKESLQAMDPFINKMVEMMLKTMSYKIVDTKENKDGYAFKVEYEVIDDKAFSSAMEAIGGEEASAISEQIIMDLVSSGKITENTSDEDLIKILMEEITGELMPFVEDAMKKAGTVKEEIELVAVWKNKKWLIDLEKTDALKTLKEGSSIGVSAK